MSTNINPNLLKDFIMNDLKIGKTLSLKEAQELNIEQDYFNLSNDLDTQEIDIDDVIDNYDLYEQFATIYVQEKENQAQAKDKEQEKEEQTAIKNKNNAGI